MDITGVFLLCICTVAHFVFPPIFACDRNLQVELRADKTSVRVKVNDKADLNCCYKPVFRTNVPNVTWVMRFVRNDSVTDQVPVHIGPTFVTTDKMEEDKAGFLCNTLTLTEAQLNDTGFYQCFLKHEQSCLFSYGTYLQVYNPLPRTLDISEQWKNSIITIEGVLLFFAVLIPGICQLGKTKRLTQLNRKKLKEEENIYEGLNLDDCNSTYHQIQRTNRHGPYQDVANTAEDDIQFEKP